MNKPIDVEYEVAEERVVLDGDAEMRSLRAELERASRERDGALWRASAAEMRIERLTRALKELARYARHDERCSAYPCRCGLLAVVREALSDGNHLIGPDQTTPPEEVVESVIGAFAKALAGAVSVARTIEGAMNGQSDDGLRGGGNVHSRRVGPVRGRKSGR
jgi:hypothetical protein